MIQPFRSPYPPIRTDLERRPAPAPDALTQVLDFLMDRATPRDERAVNDYLVGYTVQPAEGVYHLVNGELVWNSPDDENIHIEISVRDALDGRFLPGMTVFVTLVDVSGSEIGTRRQPFIWHPWLYDYGYGRNWQVPASGRYTLRVRVEPAASHDGQQASPVTVEFRNILVEVGVKARR